MHYKNTGKQQNGKGCFMGGLVDNNSSRGSN